MALLLSNEASILKLESIQNNIEPTDIIISGTYACDCTGCSSRCFEFCSDGQGPTD